MALNRTEEAAEARHAEIMRLWALGLTQRQIAGAVGLERSGVSHHVCGHCRCFQREDGARAKMRGATDAAAATSGAESD